MNSSSCVHVGCLWVPFGLRLVTFFCFFRQLLYGLWVVFFVGRRGKLIQDWHRVSHENLEFVSASVSVYGNPLLRPSPPLAATN